MKKETLDIKTVCECNRCLGCQTLHPQVSIINLEHPGLEQSSIKFEFYTILLIEKGTDECCCCGRKSYDYAYSTMVFLMPGEIFRMNRINTLPDKGWLLAFHPDLLYRTSLKNNIENYTFFAYRKEEALHLSQRETAKIVCCLENIDEELHHAIDMHSSTILSRHIELSRGISNCSWTIARVSMSGSSSRGRTSTKRSCPAWKSSPRNPFPPAHSQTASTLLPNTLPRN